MKDTLEELLRKGLSRKFYAKLKRIAEEFHAEPAVIVNEGVEKWRKDKRLMQGPMAKRLQDPEKLQQYSVMQSMAAKMTAEGMSEEDLKKRALAGAKARAANLKKAKKKKPESSTPTDV